MVFRRGPKFLHFYGGGGDQYCSILSHPPLQLNFFLCHPPSLLPLPPSSSPSSSSTFLFFLFPLFLLPLQELRVEVLGCLGNLGAVLLRKNDSDLFFNHLFLCLYAARDDESKVYHLDVVTLVLQSFSQRASKYQVRANCKDYHLNVATLVLQSFSQRASQVSGESKVYHIDVVTRSASPYHSKCPSIR